MEGYAPAFEEGTKSNCGSLGDMQLLNQFYDDPSGYTLNTKLALAVKPFRFSINSSFNLLSLVSIASSSGFGNEKRHNPPRRPPSHLATA
ncbi:unnamed protein product [Prunus armeniaca]